MEGKYCKETYYSLILHRQIITNPLNIMRMKTNKNLLLMTMVVSFLFLSSSVFADDNMHKMQSDNETTTALGISKAKETLKDDSFCYFDNQITDSIKGRGGKSLYFLDWLFKAVKGFNGTYGLLEKHVRTMVPEVDDSFDLEGPSFKHKPIIWIVNDKFFALTGTRNHNLKYKACSFYEKDLSLMLYNVSKVYISKKDEVWKPWFEYDNLSEVRPITMFIYTNK